MVTIPIQNSGFLKSRPKMYEVLTILETISNALARLYRAVRVGGLGTVSNNSFKKGLA